jgi:sortase A
VSAVGTDLAPARGTGQRVASTLGELLVTLGALLLLLVVYQVWWTNVASDRATATASRQLEAQWDGAGRGQPVAGQEYPDGVRSGQGFAFMYLPRLGDGWREPVIQGVTLDDLAKGVGHYPGSALPGAVGNFAVAGHRATNGEPFATLDRIRQGDYAVVETATRFYVYRLGDPFIVAPTRVAVIAPVPDQPGATPTQRLITLTTCNPRWASYERMIIHGTLVETRPKSDGPPPQLSAGG